MMKFWQSKKKREIAAIEEANQLKKEELALKAQRNKLDEQVLVLISEMETSKSYQSACDLPEIPAGVIPHGKQPAIAQDSIVDLNNYAAGAPHFYKGFIGYPALANMSQSTDYRCVYETTAQEMTRTWGEVKVANGGNEDYKDKIKAIEGRLKELNIRELMRKHIENEMIFGRSQIFIDIRQHKHLDIPLLINDKSLGKGCLKGFTLIEPIWTTPSFYNANDATSPDFFKPLRWFVLGKEIHDDRLLTLIMRPVPDMLKPVYNFGGISMLQLMQPYVERWQRTVDSVSDLIHSFSITGIKTDMQNVISDGGEGTAQLLLRSKLFSLLRSNQNLMMLDKDGEEFFQFNTPLSTLDNLLQKSQEQMAAPSRTPLVKLLGVTPSGLNASSDGEIQVYHEYIASMQEAHLRPQIEVILNLIQLDLFGKIDDQIIFEFNPLEQMNGEQLATIEKSKAERDVSLISAGVLAQEEVRTRLAKDESGDYSGIDIEDVPIMPELEFDYASKEKEAADAT